MEKNQFWEKSTFWEEVTQMTQKAEDNKSDNHGFSPPSKKRKTQRNKEKDMKREKFVMKEWSVEEREENNLCPGTPIIGEIEEVLIENDLLLPPSLSSSSSSSSSFLSVTSSSPCEECWGNCVGWDCENQLLCSSYEVHTYQKTFLCLILQQLTCDHKCSVLYIGEWVCK